MFSFSPNANKRESSKSARPRKITTREVLPRDGSRTTFGKTQIGDIDRVNGRKRKSAALEVGEPEPWRAPAARMI